METKALLVLDTWSTSTEFKTDLINTMKSNGLNIITDLEATDIVLALNYMTSLIYSYYKNYYLSNASKERTLELMSITASGKLNFYASELKAYKDAYAHDFKSLGGNVNSSSHDTTLNRSGKSKQATTPETIAKGSDYIDDYSSSEQKYENSNKETGSRSYNSTIKGSEQDYWKNIISIPKRLFEDIIGSFSKFFFSSSMELTPCAVLTIEQALQKMKEEIKNIDTTTKTEIETLSTLIKKTQTQVSNLEESVTLIDSKVQKLDNKITKTNTNLENLTKVTPTDIGVKDKKLGLKHDTNWLTNQDAITLGENLTYDETTKTLNAKGGDGNDEILVIHVNEANAGITLTQEQYDGLISGKYKLVRIINREITYVSWTIRVDGTTISLINIGIFLVGGAFQIITTSYYIDSPNKEILPLFDTLALLAQKDGLDVSCEDTDGNEIGYKLTPSGVKIKLTSKQTDSLLLNEDITFTQEQYNSIIATSLVDLYITIDSQSILAYRMNVRPMIDSNGNFIWVLVSNTTKGTKYLTQKATNGLVFASTNVDTNEHPITEAKTVGSGVNLFWQFKFVSEPNIYSTFYSMPNPQKSSDTYTLISHNGTAKWVKPIQYYEHDGMLNVNSNYIMFKYISNDSVAQTDFSQLINDFSGNYITASGSFVLGTDQIAMVYGIDFNTLMLSCNVLDMSTHNLGSDDIAFSDLKIGTYSENVRLIQ